MGRLPPLLDYSVDGVAQFISLEFTDCCTHEWVQAGYVLGRDPIGINYSPVLYTESRTTCPDPTVPAGQGPGYWFRHWPTPSLRDKLWIYRPQGSLFTCYAGGYKHIYFYRRGTMDFAYAWIRADTVAAYVGSEHHDYTHIEENGLACFGASTSCGASTSEGLYYYFNYDGSWRLWVSGVSVWVREDPCYDYWEMAAHYSFFVYDRFPC